MSSIMPQGEMIRRAAAYVAEKCKDNPQKPLNDILDEAGMKFNLTPLDAETLYKIFFNSTN